MRKILTKEAYLNFLDIAKYEFVGDIVAENNQNLKTLKNKGFCDYQIDKFEKAGNRTGCCLNFSMYLLARYQGLLLTCKDGEKGIHCAFVYKNKNGQICVCDPAKAKMNAAAGQDDICFDVPLKKYSFKNLGQNGEEAPQTYQINLAINPKDEEIGFFKGFLATDNIKVERMSNLDVKQIEKAINEMNKEKEF